MSAPARIPTEVDDLDAPWFGAVLGLEVTAATVLDRSSGTTGRARVALRGEPGVPPSVFVKLAPFDADQRVFVTHTGMGVKEARFYRDLAAEMPVRVPGVWFSATDGADYVMVLEDLVAGGCRFPTPDDPDIAHRATDIVEQCAALHAHYWESPRFASGGDLEWLVPREVTRDTEGGRMFVQQAVDVLGDRMDDAFHRIAAIYIARTADIVQIWQEGPGTLVHGDSHIGNLFVDTRDDRTGFLDWAVLCRSPGIRDIAYTMCNSVPTDVRESIERGLVDRYCELLAASGVAVDPDTEWDRYRVHAVYSWVAAAATAGMGSKWQPAEVGISATRRTTAACAHLDSVGALESILG